MKEVKTTCDYIFAPFAYKDRLTWYDRNMSANFSRQYVEIVVFTLTFIEGILKLKFDMEVEFTTTVIGILVFCIFGLRLLFRKFVFQSLF